MYNAMPFDPPPTFSWVKLPLRACVIMLKLELKMPLQSSISTVCCEHEAYLALINADQLISEHLLLIIEQAFNI